MNRKKIVRMIAAASLALAFPLAHAQSQGLQIVVPFAPGGSGDITARLLGQYVTEKTGQTVVVDNKPGGSGLIGVTAAKAAKPDGRTLLLATTTTHAANPSLFKKLPYDPEKDFTVVGILGAGGSYLLVNADAPFKTLADFVAQAKAKPGAFNYGYFNASSIVPGALMKSLAGVELTGVPYKQVGNAITDLMAGRVQVIFLDTTAADTFVQSGKLRALAVTTPKRLSTHPEVPAMAESFPGFEVTSFLGVAVSSAAPDESKQSLNKLVNDAITSEPMKSKLESFGFVARRMSLKEAADFTRAERSKWARYIAAAKIEPE